MSALLTPENYESCLDEVFTITLPDHQTCHLTLTQVKRQHDNEVQLSFALFFLGKTPGVLAQRIYRLSHPRLGELDLFLVPIQQKKTGGVLYESVFNLLKDDTQ